MCLSLVEASNGINSFYFVCTNQNKWMRNFCHILNMSSTVLSTLNSSWLTGWFCETVKWAEWYINRWKGKRLMRKPQNRPGMMIWWQFVTCNSADLVHFSKWKCSDAVVLSFNFLSPTGIENGLQCAWHLPLVVTWRLHLLKCLSSFTTHYNVEDCRSPEEKNMDRYLHSITN